MILGTVSGSSARGSRKARVELGFEQCPIAVQSFRSAIVLFIFSGKISRKAVESDDCSSTEILQYCSMPVLSVLAFIITEKALRYIYKTKFVLKG